MELKTRLSEAGFEVVGVVTPPSKALRLAAAEPPALIVMDIRLAGRRTASTRLSEYALSG